MRWCVVWGIKNSISIILFVRVTQSPAPFDHGIQFKSSESASQERENSLHQQSVEMNNLFPFSSVPPYDKLRHI